MEQHALHLFNQRRHRLETRSPRRPATFRSQYLSDRSEAGGVMDDVG